MNKEERKRWTEEIKEREVTNPDGSFCSLHDGVEWHVVQLLHLKESEVET